MHIFYSVLFYMFHFFLYYVPSKNFFFFYLTILQPDITGYRGRKKINILYNFFTIFLLYKNKRNDSECE